MSSNRIPYDKCAYELQMDRSIGPGDYRLFREYAEHNNPCFSFNGPTGSKADVSHAKLYDELADVESDLLWRKKYLTKCNYNDNPFNKYKIYNKNNCSNKLTAEDSRFTHPIDNYRSMSLTEYQYEPYLHINPQCHIQSDRIGLDTRLYSKDTYKIPKQISWDTNIFPVEKPGYNLLPVCSCKMAKCT